MDIVSNIEDLKNSISKNGVQAPILPYYKSNDFTLYNADSLDIMSRLPESGTKVRVLRMIYCFTKLGWVNASVF